MRVNNKQSQAKLKKLWESLEEISRVISSNSSYSDSTNVGDGLNLMLLPERLQGL